MQVKPSPAALSELQSQLNDMLDDSTSDDAASISQLMSPGPLTQQPSQSPQPALRQAPGLSPDASITGSPMQPSGSGTAQMRMQAGSPGLLQPGAAADAQDAQLKMQLQVWNACAALHVTPLHCRSSPQCVVHGSPLL